MKLKSFLMLGIAAAALTSCGSSKSLYMEAAAPEEGSLNLVKITDEGNNSVMASRAGSSSKMTNYATTWLGISGKNMYAWHTNHLLSVSPDGKKIAYVTHMNNQSNVMVRSTSSQSLATQRTFRNVGSFSWGNDGNLYFSDANGNNNYICSVNAEQGSMMKQHTSGAVNDKDPVLSSDGTILFFSRGGNTGPAIWSLNLKDGTLTSCARGYNPCLIPGINDAFYCVRNSTAGRSEIWYVNYVKGEESLVASDMERSFTMPALSPDGKWLAMVGNGKSSISNEKNLDIFVIRTDGTNLTQLTYHPANDSHPAWSKDGRSIFFISSRANKTQSYNIWRMNFNLE